MLSVLRLFFHPGFHCHSVGQPSGWLTSAVTFSSFLFSLKGHCMFYWLEQFTNRPDSLLLLGRVWYSWCTLARITFHHLVSWFTCSSVFQIPFSHHCLVSLLKGIQCISNYCVINVTTCIAHIGPKLPVQNGKIEQKMVQNYRFYLILH